jgi:PAS domain S-box-containing protein
LDKRREKLRPADQNRSKESLIQELEALRHRERQLRAVINLCPIPFFLKDTQGHYVVVNQEFQKWYNANESEIMGGSLEMVLPPGRAEAARQRDAEVLSSGETNDRELNWVFPDSVSRATIGTKFPVFDEDGDAIGIGGVRVDVTALREAESALEKAHRELERANQELERRVSQRTRELATEVENHKSTSEALRTNETLLRLVMDSLPVLIAYLDSGIQYGMINKTGANWYDRPVTEIVGKSPDEIFGFRPSSWGEKLKEMLQDGVIMDERQTRYPDGVTRDVQTFFLPQFSPEGEVTGVFVLTVDVSVQKNAERERRKNEILLQSVIDNAPARLALKDLDGRYLIVNEAFAKPRGLTPKELIGTRAEDHSAADHASVIFAQHQKVIETGLAITEERDVVLRNSDPLQRLITKFPVFDNEGNVTSIGSFSTDISALKAAEKTVHKALIKAQDANRSKQEFLANMSHDLRTPLNAIIGFSDIMRLEVFGEITNDRYRDYVADVSQSAHHLLEQVNHILDLSKIEAGKTKLSYGDFNISELVDITIRELQPQVEKKSLTVTTDIDQGVASIRADRTAVRQMLTNLLTNAVKFTHENGAINVCVIAFGEKSLKITVSDTGIGIPETEIPKVTLPFSQVVGVEISNETGSGLGLSIVRLLAGLHGGALRLKAPMASGPAPRLSYPEHHHLNY